MRSKFTEQLQTLNNKIVEMGEKVTQSITLAIKALVGKDVESAKQIMQADTIINHLQKQIENICFDLLIQQQPVAKDLRLVTAALKMVTDMERIGDHAADISEMTILLGQNSRIDLFPHISKMATETMLMLNAGIEAYVTRNIAMAHDVIAYDDVVDELFNVTKADIIRSIAKRQTEGEDAADLLLVAKYLERIGDHTTNIAEWVIYALQTTESVDADVDQV